MKPWIFWDNDGVLVETEGLYFQATVQVLKKYQCSIPKEEYINLNLIQGQSPLAQVLTKNGANQKTILQAKKDRDDIYADFICRGIKPIKNVEGVLKKLHTKVWMGIVTSSKKQHFELIHQQTNFLKYFEFYITREDFVKSKPDPEPYLKALRKTNQNPKKCMVVEDSRRGLVSATVAGIPTCILETTLTQTMDYREAIKVFQNVEDLGDYLIDWAGHDS